MYNLHNDTPNSRNVAIGGVSKGGVSININSENCSEPTALEGVPKGFRGSEGHIFTINFIYTNYKTYVLRKEKEIG